MASLAYWRTLEEPGRAPRFDFSTSPPTRSTARSARKGSSPRPPPIRLILPIPPQKPRSDHFVRAFHDTYGLPVLVTNCSNNYGPFQFPEKLIPVMVLNALEGKPLPVYGDGKNVRDWLYVEDQHPRLGPGAGSGNAGGDVQRGGGLRTDEPGGRRGDLPDGGCPAPRSAPSPLPIAADVRHRPSRPRPALRDRHREDPPGTGDGPPESNFESGLTRTAAWYLENPNWLARVASGELPTRAAGVDTRGRRIVNHRSVNGFERRVVNER